MPLASTIKQCALDAGFDLVGIASPAALKDLEFLPQWVKKGYGGEMHYLADPRRQDPRRVLPTVKSIICVGLIYNSSYPYSTEVCGLSRGETGRNSKIETRNSPYRPPSFERASTVHGAPANALRPRVWISRYAWGRDYHKVMRGKLEQLRAALEREATGAETRVYVDTGPIVERAFARLSGIGWMGKNTCLISERKGSWFFLGVILTNLDLELDLPAPDRCGSCTRCLEACPTGALVEPYVMDASRCISYFNIELKGSIPEQFRKAIGNNVFGCDICQDVCPWNNHAWSGVRGPLRTEARRDHRSRAGSPQRRAATTSLPEFQPLQAEIKSQELLPGHTTDDGSATPLTANESLSLFNPPLEWLASLTEEDFRRVFARSPIKRVKYRGWLRNLCVAMGNSGNRQFIPWLEKMARNPDSMVREHALWALRQLSAAARSN